jgi:hypothetical protein
VDGRVRVKEPLALRAKVAVTVLSEVITTVHEGPDAESCPDQERNVDEASVVAVNVTVVPLEKEAEETVG